MSKQLDKIVVETVARWRDTITNKTPINPTAARTLLQKAHPKAKLRFFEVRSPAEFYIAQAVIRGRIPKHRAVEIAQMLDIAPDFIKPLKKLGSPIQITERSVRWDRPELVTNTLLASFQKYVSLKYVDINVINQLRADQDKTAVAPPNPVNNTLHITTANFMLQDLKNLYSHVIPVQRVASFVAAQRRRLFDDKAEETPDIERELGNLNWQLNFDGAQQHVELACGSRASAVSRFTTDIMRNTFSFPHHSFDAVHTEIICKSMRCKNPEITWFFEIFHHIPAFMQFTDAYLMLVEQPILHTNEAAALHNDAGPAVIWPDNKKLWYINGHCLDEFAEQIVLRPTELTKDDILTISNEETRRIAIDRMGWNKYLTAIGAKIVNKRENWVDNTVEVLIDPQSNEPTAKKLLRQDEPLRMVLSCRSTGRKYFLAVPRDIPHPDANNRIRFTQPELPSTAIRTCEQAQNWLANGATNRHVDFAKYPINVVGAS
jgi:hypothetical protein